MKHAKKAAVLLMLLTWLSGCTWRAPPYGAVAYQIVYPSGCARDSYTWDDTAPIAGTDWQLAQEEGTLQILDPSGAVRHSYPELGSKTMRGEDAGNGTAWVCCEHWRSIHFNGYRSGDLTRSDLLLADLESGAVLFQEALEENELFLTASGGKCYFYDCSTRENAQIYFRELPSWGERTTVYEFDFQEWPDGLDDAHSVENYIRFYLEEGSISVAFTTYEQTDKETNRWEHLEQSRVTVPLDEEGPSPEPMRSGWVLFNQAAAIIPRAGEQGGRGRALSRPVPRANERVPQIRLPLGRAATQGRPYNPPL